MLKKLFGIQRGPNEVIVEAIYGKIVAAARQPRFYAEWGVPDTPLGRFEMMCLHMFLFLHRARGQEPALAAVAQEVTDAFFLEMDHSLRELGIGDLGVPKRMKKLARMFYGRTQSYGAALEAADRDALARALARNVVPDTAGWGGAEALADYAFLANAELAARKNAEILGGGLDFPPASAAG